MRSVNIKNYIPAAAFIACMSVAFNSCKIDELVDPNNPSIESIEADASVAELNNLVTGMEAGMRPAMDAYLDDCGIVGREFYHFTGSDPRFTSDLLGKGETSIDNNTFYLVNPWSSRYRVIRNGWILLHAVDNTTADMTDEQKNGYRGFAKTIQAYQLLLNLNLTYSCGIRLDTEDPDNLGGFTDYNGGLDGIISLLNEAMNDLNNSGTEFSFVLSSGFAGFETPENFKKFNRALAARVLLYKADYAGSLTALSESFLDLTGSISKGVYHVYSNGAGDILNDMFLPLNGAPGGDIRCVHNSFVDDAQPGDLRLAKAPERDEPAFTDDLTSSYDLFVYQSSFAPICVIRNEELILIYAEASMRMGAAGDAVTAIDKIRTEAGGLAAYSGGTTDDELLNEILYERRYSLMAEGHRWIDMRRTDKLGELPLDRPGDDVFAKFPRPYDEGEPCE